MNVFTKIAAIVMIPIALTSCAPNAEQLTEDSRKVSENLRLRIKLVCIDSVGYIYKSGHHQLGLAVKIDPATLQPERCTDSDELSKRYTDRLSKEADQIK